MVRKNKHLTYKKQKGRGFLSKGSFGCAYRPPLKCEGNTQRKTNGITKLMFEVQADIEYKATQILETIDPAKEYFLTATRLCKPAPPEASNDVSKSTCNLLKDPPVKRGKNLIHESNIASNLSNAKLVEYPDGGQDLEKFRPNVNNFVQYFKGFATLLEGLVKLHAAGYAHLDIKAANVVAKRGPMPATGEQEIYMRFIDFGFLTNAENFFTTLSAGQRRSAYALWPHDMYFTLGCSHNDLFVTSASYYDPFLQKYKSNVKSFSTFSTFSQLPERFLDSLHNMNFKDVQKLYEKYAELSPNETQRVEVLLPKIDIYMLGVLLSSQYSRFVLQYESYSGNVQAIQPYPMSTPQKTWFASVKTNVSVPLFALINKMLDLDFTKRISAADALTEYESILTAMEPLFTEANIQSFILPLRPLGPADARPLPPPPPSPFSPPSLPLSPPTPPPANQTTGGLRKQSRTRKKKSSHK